MIAPIAAVIFATAMALSLSVEAESFFHTPTRASAGPDEAEHAGDADDTVDSSDESTAR